MNRLPAATVLLALVGVLVACSDEDSSPPPPSALTVGRNHAVVNLDETWALDGPDDPTVGNKVRVSAGVSRLDAPGPPGTSIVNISAAPRRLGSEYTALEREDVEAFVRVIEVNEAGFTTTELVVPSEDASFVIVATQEGMTEQIVDSLEVLPGNLVAVPNVTSGASDGIPGYSALPSQSEVRLRLKVAGLTASFESSPSSKTQPSGFLTSVPAGTVVPVGSVVKVFGRLPG